MSAVDSLLVISHRYRWLARELADAAPPGCQVDYSHGFELPDRPAGTFAVWTPAGHAARLFTADWPFDAAAPGPAWLERLPGDLLARRIWTGRLDQVGDGPPEGFWKPAEAKIDDLPAAWRTASELVEAATRLELPAATIVQAADRRLDLAVEYRCLVVDGTVHAASAYLDATGATWEPEWDDRTDVDLGAACELAQAAVDAAGGPAGFTVDVAQTTAGEWLVLEANPVWCADPYGCDPQVMFAAVAAATCTPGDPGPWRWTPDPALAAEAARSRAFRLQPRS